MEGFPSPHENGKAAHALDSPSPSGESPSHQVSAFATKAKSATAASTARFRANTTDPFAGLTLIFASYLELSEEIILFFHTLSDSPFGYELQSLAMTLRYRKSKSNSHCSSPRGISARPSRRISMRWEISELTRRDVSPRFTAGGR